MNLRHATAIALAGWYLIAPPESYKKHLDQDVTAIPLGIWKILNSFDDANSYEQSRHDFNSDGVKRINHPKDSSDRFLGIRFGAAVYVATDDPRLKEK
jgi:hypothetical protein